MHVPAGVAVICRVTWVTEGKVVVTGGIIVTVPRVIVTGIVPDEGGDTAGVIVSVMTGTSVPDDVATAPAVTVAFVV
jgi:hypothetical protein